MKVTFVTVCVDSPVLGAGLTVTLYVPAGTVTGVRCRWWSLVVAVATMAPVGRRVHVTVTGANPTAAVVVASVTVPVSVVFPAVRLKSARVNVALLILTVCVCGRKFEPAGGVTVTVNVPPLAALDGRVAV